MRVDIYFTDKQLILTNEPVVAVDYYRMPSSDLSRVNVVNRFKSENVIAVIDSMIEYYIEQFFSEFQYIDAAGGLVDNERGETLMIYCYRHWDLPKGHIDEGESAEVCAVREVAEEAGVKGAKVVKFICHTLHAYGYQGVWELKRTSWYQLVAPSCEPTPQTEEDIVIAKWCSAEEVEENLRASYPTIRKVFAAKKAAQR